MRTRWAVPVPLCLLWKIMPLLPTQGPFPPLRVIARARHVLPTVWTCLEDSIPILSRTIPLPLLPKSLGVGMAMISLILVVLCTKHPRPPSTVALLKTKTGVFLSRRGLVRTSLTKTLGGQTTPPTPKPTMLLIMSLSLVLSVARGRLLARM